MVTDYRKGVFLTTRAALSSFLAGVEKRAFKQAFYALRNEEHALDAVQDAMLKLVSHYAQHPEEKWAPLFQRILQNCIHDIGRRQSVRARWVSLFSSMLADEHAEEDWLALQPDTSEQRHTLTPEAHYEQKAMIELIEQELGRLPARQREAFLMRYWEGLSITETAAAMACSEGSVKTHCSRAVHTLAEALRQRGVKW